MTPSQEIRDLESQLNRTARAALTVAEAINKIEDANRRVGKSSGGGSNVPNAGGSAQSPGGSGAESVLRTMGFVTPQSIGTSISAQNRLAQAAKQAGDAIKTAYQGSATWVKELDRYVEQATGHVVVQAEMLRELKDAAGNVTGKQSFTATSRVDPFSGKQSQYTAGQQAFANQSGGIDKANQALSKYGLTLNNVTGFYKDLNSGVARFSVTGTDGVSTAMGAMDQFGNSTIHAARNAQTLAQNVGRNIEKVVEWAIATTVLYTVMNSVMTAGKELQDIEETMIDISIATGAAGEELNRYYQAALDVANLTGSDVTETMEAQAKAYRAAGSEGDRFGTANILLKDSMILSRLATMEQSKALDTLVAALRQSGMELTEGQSLLDKWVRTSQIAGVSIEDLAESFAITADVATTVGVTLDELNGVIAVLAEKTTLSGTEVGNAARTMFAGITSDEAVSTLGEFGIAVRTVGGDMRDWMDINQDVVDMINAGILNDEQINKLANAIGGGSRRGPQLITLWRNFGAVSTIAGESMNASGEAADAMQIKLDSLQAAINELHNAFNELVQTLGYDGGFLEMMTDIVDLASNLVKSLTDIADSFDDGAASVTGMLVAFMGFQKLTRGMNMGGFNTLGAGIGGNRGVNSANGMLFAPRQTSSFSGVGNYLGQQASAGTMQAGVQGMFGAGGAVAIGEALSGAPLEQAAPRVAAALAGAFVGNMILPGAGGVIGGVIADSFVRQVQERQDLISEVTRGDTVDLSASELQNKINALTMGGFGQTGATPSRTMQDKYDDTEIAKIVQRALQSGDYATAPKGRDINARTAFFEEKGYGEIESKFLAGMTQTSDQVESLLTLYDQLGKAVINETEAHEALAQSIPTSVVNQASLLQGPQGAALRGSFASQEASLYREAGRTGNVEDYNKQTGAMKQLETATAAVANAQYGLNTTTEQYIGLGNLLLNTTPEQRDKIILLASGINEVRDRIEELKKEGRGGVNLELEQAGRELQSYETQLDHVLELTEKSNAIQFARDNYSSPTQAPTGPNGEALTQGQAGLDTALAEARKAQDVYAEYLGIDPQALRESVTDPLILAFADGYVTIEGLTSDFSKLMIDKMKETAEGMKEEMNFTFRDMRDTSASMIDNPAFAQRLKANEQLLQSAYGPYGYKEEKQNVGLMLEGNQTRVLNTTMTALNLTLEELTEVEKKQLEGQWNLPSGATAYVPINSLFASQSGGGMPAGGGGGDPYNTGITQQQAADTQQRAAQMQLQAAEAQRIRDLDSSRWEGLGREYTERNGGKETKIETETNVNITPSQTILNLDGRVLANVTQQYLSEQTSNVSRTTPGSGPKII
jgi:TP901 family phage tail tape measure protein